MNTKADVDNYIASHSQWCDVLSTLRKLLQETRMEEQLKWGMPVYSFERANIVGIIAFKNYVALWFYQGVFLKDDKQVLINAQEGKTKALRQWKFHSHEALDIPLIKNYLAEAIQNQKEGKQIKKSKAEKVVIPKALEDRISKDHALKDSFNTLSLSKQKTYAEYIEEAKREETKHKRLEKIIPMILEGIGLNDHYTK